MENLINVPKGNVIGSYVIFYWPFFLCLFHETVLQQQQKKKKKYKKVRVVKDERNECKKKKTKTFWKY